MLSLFVFRHITNLLMAVAANPVFTPESETQYGQAVPESYSSLSS
jgi:hypothetical protein